MIKILIVVAIAIIALVLAYYLIGYIIRKYENKCSVNNIKTSKGKSSSYRGVHYDKTKRRWKSGITINGSRYNTGSFMTEEEAFYALEQLKAELNYEG